MVFLNSDLTELSRQEELAEILDQSKTSRELLDKLKEITAPTPRLALAICQAYRRGRRIGAGLRLLQNSDLPIPCDDQSRRLYVQLKHELAYCQTHVNRSKAWPMYADAVQSSIDLLGKTHKQTTRVRCGFAGELEVAFLYSGALDVLSALKADNKDFLDPWKQFVPQMEARILDKMAKQGKRKRPPWIEKDEENIRCLLRGQSKGSGNDPMTEEDKENIPRGELHRLSKRRKLITCTQQQAERGEETKQV